MDVLVWANNRFDAVKAAKAEESLDSFDAEDNGLETNAYVTDPKVVAELPANTDTVLLVPDDQRGHPFPLTWKEVKTPVEFIAFLGEEGEQLRIKSMLQ